MLPVSGALQLKASDAQMCPPIASHKCAYSRLLRPAPSTNSSDVAAFCNTIVHRTVRMLLLMATFYSMNRK